MNKAECDAFVAEHADVKDMSAVYGKAMDIATVFGKSECSKNFFDAIVDFIKLKMSYDTETAQKEASQGIGWHAGYGDHGSIEKVFAVYGCMHPFFGSITPSPEQAFRIGKDMGSKIKQQEG